MNEPRAYSFDEFTDEVLSDHNEVFVYLASDPAIARALAIAAVVTEPTPYETEKIRYQSRAAIIALAEERLQSEVGAARAEDTTS